MRTVGTFFAAIALTFGSRVASAATTSSRWTITPRQPVIRLAVNRSCPSNINGVHDITNPPARARTMLVPNTPVAGIICRYGTVAATSRRQHWELVRSARLVRADAHAIASALDHLSTQRPQGGFYCPAAFAEATLIALSYRSGTDADIWYAETGCATVDNGYLEAILEESPAAFGRFASLVEHLAARS